MVMVGVMVGMRPADVWREAKGGGGGGEVHVCVSDCVCVKTSMFFFGTQARTCDLLWAVQCARACEGSFNLFDAEPQRLATCLILSRTAKQASLLPFFFCFAFRFLTWQW